MKIKGYIIGISSVQDAYISSLPLTCLWLFHDVLTEDNIIQVFIPEISNDMFQKILEKNMIHEINDINMIQESTVDMLSTTDKYRGKEVEIEFEPSKNKFFLAEAIKSVKIDNIEISDIKDKNKKIKNKKIKK
jgi:5-enolpyruvylshikimate-3-phosphate synthase